MKSKTLLSLFILVALAAGCTSTPTGQVSAAGDGKTPFNANAIAAYKRSKPTLPPPTQFQDLGTVDNENLTLQFNPTLAFGQAREVCDEKPIEAIMIPPKRVRQCVSMSIYNNNLCSQYEDIPGESQPACLMPCLTCSTGMFSCAIRADPNKPTPGYRYAKDCYQTPATSDVQGRLRVYAVPEDTAPLAITSRGDPIGQVVLGTNGAPQTITLSRKPKPDECLALADTSGQAIPVRSGSGYREDYLFASARLQADKRIAEFQRKADQAEQVLAKRRAEADSTRRAVLQNVAWKGDRCEAPAMRQFPPEPTGLLSAQEIEANAEGYCTILLMYQVGTGPVASALMATENEEYVDRAKFFKGELNGVARCARKTHRYSESEVTQIRGGVEAPRVMFDENLASSGSLATAVMAALIGGLDVKTRPRMRTDTMVVNMVEQCKAKAVRACDQPRINWRQNVERIRNEPQEALTGCGIAVDQANRANSALREAEQAAAAASTELVAARTAAIPQRLSLAQAVCKAQ
jgi:hypothetical protein